MNKKNGSLFSRRQFARRAAVLSATASIVPAEAILSGKSSAPAPQTSPGTSSLSPESQLEAESRYQQILTLYGQHLDDTQKANIKKMCADVQSTLDKIRKYKLQNGDAPALYLKPLVERDKKRPSASTAKP